VFFLRVFSMPCAVFSLWGRFWKLHRLTWSFIFWHFFTVMWQPIILKTRKNASPH
jgi:hypothetical protein